MKTLEQRQIAVKQLIDDVLNYWVGGYEKDITELHHDTIGHQRAIEILYKTPIKVLQRWFYEEVQHNDKGYESDLYVVGVKFIEDQISEYINKNQLGLENNPNM